MKIRTAVLTIAVLAAASASAEAQGRGRGRDKQGIPPGHMPPPGMCRIWIDGVPPGRQPAPTDCETALRNQPRNSRIIWGENARGRIDRDSDRRERDDRADRRERRDRDDRDRDARDRSDRNRDRDRNSRDGGSSGYPGGSSGGAPVDRGQYPSQLPAMTGAVLIRVGVRTVDVQNWLGSGSLRSETVDSNGDGVPEQATWYDSQGTLLQVWHDSDRDGRADSVDIYRNGQRVQVIR